MYKYFIMILEISTYLWLFRTDIYKYKLFFIIKSISNEYNDCVICSGVYMELRKYNVSLFAQSR